MRSSLQTRRLLHLLCWCLLCAPCLAAKLVVLEARGGVYKAGMSLDSSAVIALKEGERLTVIGADGRSVTLKGPVNGEAFAASGSAADPRLALAALVATRDARTSSVGVIRAGTAAVKIPEPWLVDVSRPGARCLMEGELPVWWRPQVDKVEQFTLLAADRSWSAQFVWDAGQDRQAMPPLARFEGNTVYLIRHAEREHAISLVQIPKGLDNKLVLTSWMLENGCIQQADALLAQLRDELDKPP